MKIPLLALHPDAVVPRYARLGDAGADLVAAAEVHLEANGGRALVPTGVAVAIPEGYCGLILPRSGLALRHGVTCLNTPGLIDSGYRGELKCLLVNTDPKLDYEVHLGDRIAQFVLIAYTRAHFEAVEKLPASERGENGFGHSGR